MKGFRSDPTHPNLNNAIFSNEQYLYFKKRGVSHKIAIADILYVQADGDYTITYTTTANYVSEMRLKELEEKLTPYGFIKVHRSYLVNLEETTAVHMDQHFLVINGVKVPFSRRLKKDILSRLPIV